MYLMVNKLFLIFSFQKNIIQVVFSHLKLSMTISCQIIIVVHTYILELVGC